MKKIKKIFLIAISIFFAINSSNIACFATTGGSPSDGFSPGAPGAIMGYQSSCPSCSLNESKNHLNITKKVISKKIIFLLYACIGHGKSVYFPLL